MPEKRGTWKYLVSSSISWAPKSLRTVTAEMKLKDACSLEGTYDKPRQHIKKQRHHFTNKGPYGQSYDFSSSHVWMWELDHKDRWAPRNWCFWTVVLEKTLEHPLDCNKIKGGICFTDLGQFNELAHIHFQDNPGTYHSKSLVNSKYLIDTCY